MQKREKEFGVDPDFKKGYAASNERHGKTVDKIVSLRPGDLIHADKHGALVIPVEQARAVLSAVAPVERYERP